MNATGTHISRSFHGTSLEDMCPCPKAPCGHVNSNNLSEDCLEHPMMRNKTIRSSHPAEACPSTFSYEALLEERNQLAEILNTALFSTDHVTDHVQLLNAAQLKALIANVSVIDPEDGQALSISLRSI